jgi:ABC-2 type transport system ATP-binding protein
MNDPAISCEHLTVVRSGVPVLSGLELRVRAGTVTGLLGPSGSGKTTLLRAVVGTQLISGGRVTVLGRPAGSRDLRHLVGYATQGASVYDDLTVAENLRYFAAVLGLARAEADRVLAEVNLRPQAGRLAGQLSGGQRSRVSLAVALLGRPQLLVLDEPTVGLDPILREQLWTLFASLAAGGVTLLVSSHVMDEARRCDDLVLLRDGQVLTQEPPQSLLRRTGTASLDDAFLALLGAAA